MEKEDDIKSSFLDKNLQDIDLYLYKKKQNAGKPKGKISSFFMSSTFIYMSLVLLFILILISPTNWINKSIMFTIYAIFFSVVKSLLAYDDNEFAKKNNINLELNYLKIILSILLDQSNTINSESKKEISNIINTLDNIKEIDKCKSEEFKIHQKIREIEKRIEEDKRRIKVDEQVLEELKSDKY